MAAGNVLCFLEAQQNDLVPSGFLDCLYGYVALVVVHYQKYRATLTTMRDEDPGEPLVEQIAINITGLVVGEHPRF